MTTTPELSAQDSFDELARQWTEATNAWRRTEQGLAVHEALRGLGATEEEADEVLSTCGAGVTQLYGHKTHIPDVVLYASIKLNDLRARRVALPLDGQFDEFVAETARQAGDAHDSADAEQSREERQRVSSPAHAGAFALGAEGAADEDAIPVVDAPRIKRGRGKAVVPTRRPRDPGPAGT